MMYSKYTLSFIVFQMSLDLVHLKRFNHYLLRLYREEIRILENGTFPKDNAEKLQDYKKEIEEDEEMFRFKAWWAMNEDSRLYDEIYTKNYDRFKFRKKRRKGMKSSEKFAKRVRFHFLQNFLIQNHFFMRRKKHHTTQATAKPTTLLMLPYNSDKFVPRFMQKILPSFMYYKYYLPLHSIIKKVPGRIQNLVKTAVDTIKGKVNGRRKKTKHNRNKTLHRYLRKIEKSLRRLEIGLKIANRTYTTKKPSKSQKKFKVQLRRVRRKKKFKRLLKEINKMYPTPVTYPTNFLGMREMMTTRKVTWKTTRKKFRTTRRKRNRTRTSTVMSKRKRKIAEKQRKREQRAQMANLN